MVNKFVVEMKEIFIRSECLYSNKVDSDFIVRLVFNEGFELKKSIDNEFEIVKSFKFLMWFFRLKRIIK